MSRNAKWYNSNLTTSGMFLRYSTGSAEYGILAGNNDGVGARFQGEEKNSLAIVDQITTGANKFRHITTCSPITVSRNEVTTQ